ncbi:MAG: 4-hydroxy-tetrahydrodipicolinate synthase [Deltaproteobacteria bacterium]|nr:4-hydroxy-tetrahydrodipicolinate synthase [Deltaproteobacteria bacterium]MBI3387734.1 4-hydroxy-tetrahydrodipicolinate synthase [Deltaproteobacteria bacterium]
MAAPRFSGTMTALVTPFRDGQIDADALAHLVDIQIAAGISALVPCGSTGESATLSHAEHTEVVRLVVKFAKGRVPVIAGTGSNSTSEAIALTKAAKEAGATAALLISPYYNRPTQDGIYQHYRAIAEATRFPLIPYNIPARTGSKIEAATLARLADLDEVIGVKESTGSLDEVQEVARLCGDKLEIYSGDDSLTLPVMAVGGCGVISVVSNALPKESVAMTSAMLAGDLPRARALHFKLFPAIRALFLETNPIPIKAALAMMGLCRDELRLPLLPMTDGPRAKLRAALQAIGAL